MKIIKNLKIKNETLHSPPKSGNVILFIEILQKLSALKKYSLRTFLKKLKLKTTAFKDNAGFSLIEVMVSLTISSVILLIIYSAHTSITKAIYNLTGVADMYENLNLAINMIDRDISSAYYNRSNKNVCFIGESDFDPPYNGKLNFITTEHQSFVMLGNLETPFPKSDIREVGYYLKPDPEANGFFYLMKREENHYDDDPESGGEENILLENVIDLQFEFKKGNDWAKQWDSRERNRYPKAIKTTLRIKTYGGQEKDFMFLTRINIKK